jgi:type II restriction/modification system DNA methylase subunit YeeA
MTPQQFIAKWQRVTLAERSACQQHFLDLCELLDQPKPAEADPEGAWYTFEKGVQTTEGGKGWADVWMRDHFGWEYKGKHKDLKAAYKQLLLYREALENPPLLIVCDMDRFEVHTNFTGTAKQIHAFDLAGLATPANFDVLRRVFTEPLSLKPGITSEAITVEAAKRFANLADGMRDKGIEPLRAAHFLMKLMFCMFGENTKLLPSGLFHKLLETAKANFAMLPRLLQNLFDAMAHGGTFGSDVIAWFNGGLFADNDVIPLTQAEINTVANIANYDWASVEPSIFGTLFERTLDPGKRSQIGAHYTSRQDIETLLAPVLLAPLRREWEEVRRRCEEELWPKVVKTSRTRTGSASAKDSRQRKAFDRALLDFVERLAHVTVLDPACGSGNFLYVAIHMLLDLEKEVIAYAATRGLSLVPQVSPSQLHGLEINPYAQQLAQVVIWIGYLQWMHHNGFKMPSHPVLAPIESIRCMDAILDLSDPEHPKEPEWPEAEFIVGNPPFLGGGIIRRQLGDHHVKNLFALYDGRIPNFSDLCCYWFEKARAQIVAGKCKRAGLLATQGVRGGANREVINRIKESGSIFFAISDRDWVLDGANVHVSMVGFDAGSEQGRCLDGKLVTTINANLTATTDVTIARPLKHDLGVCFMGPSPKAPFDITDQMARSMLTNGANVHGRPDSDVIRRVQSGVDLTARDRLFWTLDFGLMAEVNASKYEAPFEYVVREVKPIRTGRKSQTNKNWWQYERPRVELRASLTGLPRFIATPEVAKHRVFVWRTPEFLCNQQTLVFARDDDFFFGVVHSRLHEVWARSQGTQLRERESGFRYTPTSCFETFPFPQPSTEQSAVIAIAALELDKLRTAWLNPPEWTKTEVLEFPGSVDGPWARYVVEPDARGIGTVRWPRIVPKDADCAGSLSKRTLTNLYNQRPAWLDLAHKKLDEAVLAAYGWETDLSDDELLARLLALNLERAGTAG